MPEQIDLNGIKLNGLPLNRLVKTTQPRRQAQQNDQSDNLKPEWLFLRCLNSRLSKALTAYENRHVELQWSIKKKAC